ncbi:hypothetical protein J3459_018390 [Metarhizium acridum]|nr:hypothetical protein J3459_018390 [Metarhizium acridum]
MFKQRGTGLLVLCALLILCICFGEAAPQRKQGKQGGNQGGNRGGNSSGKAKQTPQQKAAQKPGGISKAQDGSVILDTTVKINGLDIRYKVSAPADQFKTGSGVKGGNAADAADAAGTIGMNVLLHGDGGDSFFDFPNQGVNANLMGVAVLAPDINLKWGGADRGNQQRPDGVAHSQAVADLITQELPKVVSFNQSNVWFTGVSGGSLTLSGFFIPAHMGQFPNTGVLLNCGGLPPQVPFTREARAAIPNTRIHTQSSQRELSSLQRSIPQTVQAYEDEARKAGLDTQQIDALQTVDNSPGGGHCDFNGKGFTSGVRSVVSNFEKIMLPEGNGKVNGVDVKTGVVGNEKLRFTGSDR